MIKRAGGEDWHFPVRVRLPGDPAEDRDTLVSSEQVPGQP